jgi:CO dehydrogenase/acetyl-CoA synthase alpha subunit
VRRPWPDAGRDPSARRRRLHRGAAGHSGCAARWRLTHFLSHIGERLDAGNGREDPNKAGSILDPVREAVETVRRHASRIIRRWHSGHSNARLQVLTGLFQAARARARGYRSTATFACIINLIGAPIADLLTGSLST